MSNTLMITGNVDHTHLPNLPRSVLGGIRAGDSVSLAREI